MLNDIAKQRLITPLDFWTNVLMFMKTTSKLKITTKMKAARKGDDIKSSKIKTGW